MNFSNIKKENNPQNQQNHRSDTPTEDNKSMYTEEITGASTPHSKTVKYILSYDPKADMVLLITERSDGSRIISPVETIIPGYLTSEDIQNLTDGIVFTSKEDLYVQIEDFSS